MVLVDANVLLYAVNSDAPHHAQAKDWLDDALSGGRTVGFAWIVLLAFARLATSPALFSRPLTSAEAFDVLEAWLQQSSAVVVEPTARHLSVLRALLHSSGTAANLVNDAHLATLAIELDAEVVSYDHDFARFAGLRWTLPTVR